MIAVNVATQCTCSSPCTPDVPPISPELHRNTFFSSVHAFGVCEATVEPISLSGTRHQKATRPTLLTNRTSTCGVREVLPVGIGTMSSSKTQDSIDDRSFDTLPLRAADGPTGVPNFPPEEGRGDDLQPFKLEYRDFKINPLPKEPPELFQLLIPISIIQSWVDYTNSWVAYLLKNAVIDNWNTPLSEHSRILKWEGISTSTAYVWLGVVIYLGIHREITIKDHWRAPSLGDQRPLHSIIKFMPLRKFELVNRYFRTFVCTKVDIKDEGDLPKTFQAAEEWSDLIQKVSKELYLPGTNLTVDECMVPFTGRSKETTLVKGKPTPVGFKVWVIAQQGFFLRWLWHVKSSPYTAVIVNLPTAKPQGKKGKLRTEIPLSNTQSVVVHLVKRLLPQTYHVLTDNLFSSPQLFG
ncbi:Uncharacterized protein HZ326_25165 [Fusarium oxysporum f. sp. albedinis]|nr:Uncharacterized protein HZ326_25165 [Fusarium oxysporum f. sp. albedinis]